MKIKRNLVQILLFYIEEEPMQEDNCYNRISNIRIGGDYVDDDDEDHMEHRPLECTVADSVV